MNILKMEIEQGDNGWILKYCGHDLLEKKVVCSSWKKVLRELDDYFGWYDTDGKLSKSPESAED